MLQAPVLKGLPHGFSTREPPEFAAPPVLARQVHSAQVAIATGPWDGPPPAADALVTTTPGMLIGIVTADCAPVLLADREAGVVAAAHAGWRGAVGGVLCNTISAMEEMGARRGRIAAAIGPTIAQVSYEVDAAMRDHFDPAAHRFFAPGGTPGRWHFDLPGFIAAQLQAAEIAAVEALGQDTYAQAECFFSFRRATHQGEATSGRQISVIGL